MESAERLAQSLRKLSQQTAVSDPTHRLEIVPDNGLHFFPFQGGSDAVKGVFGEGR